MIWHFIQEKTGWIHSGMPGQERLVIVSFAGNISQKGIGDMQVAFCLYAGNALLVGKKRAAHWVIYQGQIKKDKISCKIYEKSFGN